MGPVQTKKRMRPSTREAITDAAVDVLTVKPGAALEEIAIRAGVGRATLHRHFPNREALLLAITEQCLDESEAAVDAATEGVDSAKHKLLHMLQAMIPLGDRYHFLAMDWVTNDRLQRRYEAQLKWTADLVAQLKTEGSMAEAVPTSWAVANIDTQIWLAWSEIASGNLAPAHAADLACETLLHGLGPHVGGRSS